MKALAVINKTSIFMLLTASAIFCVGGTIAMVFDASYLPVVLLLSLVLAILTVPLTLVSLMQAYRAEVVSLDYVIFSVLISCFLVGLGWFVIPFVLNRDVKQYIYEATAKT
ncbi:hypothetical protein [Stutzerimonas kirkiae]|uniref:hypothetical protein n=1 Tax=Stutzerimonas kirkiae TaxID=2211392 RepID=UPI001037FB37|nr:hypothetical protein [Stutzerimonas kirkiae]